MSLPILCGTGSACARGAEAADAPRRSKIIILHTNDLHFNFNHRQTFEQVTAHFRDNYKNVFLLDAGDIFARHQGSWPEPNLAFYRQRTRFMIETMNEIGYSTAVLGNHELDWKGTFTRDALRLARFPILGANVNIATDHLDPPLPHTILRTAEGHTIAVLGIAVGEGEGVTTETAVETVEKHRSLREGHNVLALLTHVGAARDRILARQFGDIDLIVGGHSHTHIDPAEIVNGVLVTQTRGHGHEIDPAREQHLGVIRMLLEDGKVTRKAGTVLTFDATGLLSDPDLWTVDIQGGNPHAGTVRRLGIDLGAEGNHCGADGLMWARFHEELAVPQLSLLLDTMDVAETPERLLSVTDRNVVDGDRGSKWQIWDHRRERFKNHLHFELSDLTSLDRLEVAWKGPAATRFRIETRTSNEWQTVFEGAGDGGDGEYQTYDFAPVVAREVRLAFGQHDNTSRDHRDRPLNQPLQVSQVRIRIGALPFPDAYAYFVPKKFWHMPRLQGTKTDANTRVASTGITGIREFFMRGVNGGGQPYRVTLHFADPDGLHPGQRLFDIYIQGTCMATGFDIVGAAQSPDKPAIATRTFTCVHIDDTLRIAFAPVAGSAYPPVLSGVELHLAAKR